MSSYVKDLGFQPAGTTATVTLSGNRCIVMLMDAARLSRYKRTGEKAGAYGGEAQRSPAQVTTPHAGHWSLVVEPAAGGRVRVEGVRVD